MKPMNFEGKVWKFGDHIDRDVIIPARFLNVSDKDELAKSCFIDTRPEFAVKVGSGDVIVAGINLNRHHAIHHTTIAALDSQAGKSILIAAADLLHHQKIQKTGCKKKFKGLLNRIGHTCSHKTGCANKTYFQPLFNS